MRDFLVLFVKRGDTRLGNLYKKLATEYKHSSIRFKFLVYKFLERVSPL